MRVACPECVGIALAPRLVHPAEFPFAIVRLTKGVLQNEFAVSIRQPAHHGHMFVNGFQSADFLARSHGSIHEVIVQAVRSRCLAVCRRCGQMLRNPPRLVTKLAIEVAESLAVSAATLGYHGEHVLTKPCQQFRIDFRADVLPRRILRCGLKFLLEFCVPGRIEFKDKAVALLQRDLVRRGQWIVFFAKRMN